VFIVAALLVAIVLVATFLARRHPAGMLRCSVLALGLAMIGMVAGMAAGNLAVAYLAGFAIVAASSLALPLMWSAKSGRHPS
jgi:hypothetical protein